MKTIYRFLILVLGFVLIINPFRLSAQTPTISYPTLSTEYSTGTPINFDVNLYSNGLIDQLCAVRYYIYKDDMMVPVASVTPFGTISYTVRSQGTSFVTNSITEGQGLIEIDALNDVLQAFTLGIFDNYCVDRDRPINIDMNLSIPGNYRFTVEIVSCSNTGISAGTTYTATSCDGLSHTDFVSDTCMTPVVLNTYSIDFKVCGPAQITRLSGPTTCKAGDPVEIVYSLGTFDNAIDASQIPSWLTPAIDNINHTLTLSGIAPAANGSQTYSFTITTQSTINPVSCATAGITENILVTAPQVVYTAISPSYQTGDNITTSALVYSNGLVDELCGVRYAIYKDNATTPIDSVNDYGTVTFTVRGQGPADVITPVKAGQGFLEIFALNDTLQAFTLGIFDNYCINRNRPIDIGMNFTVPGNYRFVAEIVSCSNAGTSIGSTFTDQNCGGTVHTDSVALECLNPTVLNEGMVETTVCGEAEISYVSGLTNYTPGDSVELIYSLGDFDNAINASQLPSWLTYSIDNVAHTLTVEGVAPTSNGVSTNSFTLTTASTINPSTCPTASVVQNIIITAPSVTYSPIDVMYNTTEDISTSALVFSNGMVDELCGVRYAIYKDNATTPIDSVNDYGTVTFTVRGQGPADVITPVKAGQGFLEIFALNDTLQAFTLGIFDNYCINRNRPIDIDMNFTVPGNYRFVAEIVSCSNAGISAGSTFTDQNCGGTVHTDSVAEECQNPVILTEEMVETTICGDAEIDFVAGDLNYFPGQPIEVIYNVGDFDDGVNSTSLPVWLNSSVDTANNTITITGTAPAYDPLNTSYNITLTTTSSENPSTCPTASSNLVIQVTEGPEITYTALDTIYYVGDSLNTTAKIYSHGYVDELSAIRYNIYRNSDPISQISDYGHIDYKVRVTGALYDTTQIETGSGFITMKPGADTLRAFTLGIFDNSCVNRNRPVDLFLTFEKPGEYNFNSELVSCSNEGTAIGTSFIAASCDNLTHYDSVAENCIGPELLFSQAIGFTVCGKSKITYANGSDSYCEGTQINLVYNVGEFDDGLNSSSFPSWLTYSTDMNHHAISLHGTVPEYDPLNPAYSITLTTSSSENPASCPTASLVQAISVKESFRDTITEVICEGDSITIMAFTYDTTGIYTNTFTASNGCDSVVVIDLTLNPTLYSEFTEITDSATYTWNAFSYNVSGDYTQTLTSTITGCDSIVTLHLTITAGFEELINDKFSVYPNPTDRFINVELTTDIQSECRIDLYDVFGQLMSSTVITDTRAMIDLSEMASGIYFLKVVTEGNILETTLITKQ